ncbi:MAG: strawberry notch family protein, partial [Novosphingobium sp.]|nr:strawberry notch family protein [Novosphingobium sp.]
MSQSALQFEFSESVEPLVLSAARQLADFLLSGAVLTRSVISDALSEQFGGSDADGRWSLTEAHAALEMAQVLWLMGQSELTVTTPPGSAEQVFAGLQMRIPTQINRSEEQVELQQFATPPRLAWLAARASALTKGDRVLEPSAGTGMLALWAAKSGATLDLNEIAASRRACLAALFPQAMVTGHDGELIDELLAPDCSPSAVLMNPPFSWSAERGHDGRTGARHLRSAFARLRPGGRLVAIMPEWFDLHRFVAKMRGPVTPLLNVTIDGGFRKSGTGIATRLLVIDKADRDVPIATARTSDFAEIAELIDALPARESLNSSLPVIPVRQIGALRLIPQVRRLPLAPPVRSAPTSEAAPVCYEALPEPAPIDEQVGHYLPYRPSRVVIADAATHPTALVESVAMGSIAAPIPEAVPQVPAGLIAKGLLSAAQAETLIYAANAHARDIAGTFEPEDEGCALKPSTDGKAYRMGYFLGDGTGAGKGRQVASVILDRWVRGERRHIWISKNEALLEDARRDWSALGGLPLDIQPLATWKLGTMITMPEGILFVTYPTLCSGRGDATRLEQIL